MLKLYHSSKEKNSIVNLNITIVIKERLIHALM